MNLNRFSNIPAGQTSTLSPLWRFLTTEHLEQHRHWSFLEQLLSQEVATFRTGNAVDLYSHDDLAELEATVGVDRGTFSQLNETQYPTLALFHKDEDLERFRETDKLKFFHFSELHEEIENGFPGGKFNIFYIEDGRFAFVTADQIARKREVLEVGEFEMEAKFFRPPLELPVMLRSDETPLGYFLNATDFYGVNGADLINRVSQQQLITPGEDDYVLLPNSDLGQVRELLKLNNERLHALQETGDPVFLAIALGAHVPRLFVESWGLTRLHMGDLIQQWLQPDIGKRASLIYFEQDKVRAFTFDELVAQIHKIDFSKNPVNFATRPVPIEEENIREADLADDQVTEIGRTLKNFDWIEEARVYQIERAHQWITVLELEVGEGFNPTSRDEAKVVLDEVAKSLVPVFDGIPFSLRVSGMSQSQDPSRDADLLKPDNQQPPEPGLGL